MFTVMVHRSKILDQNLLIGVKATLFQRNEQFVFNRKSPVAHSQSQVESHAY